jgi:hypothetical protein
MVPGASTLLARLAVERLGGADSIEMCTYVGRGTDPREGIGSLMSAFIEDAYGPLRFEGGERLPYKLGQLRGVKTMPEPCGETPVVGNESIDVFLLPEHLGLTSLRTWWAITDMPNAALALIRGLKPHRSRLGRWLVESLVKSTVKKEYAKRIKSGTSPEALFKLVAHKGPKRWEATAKFPDGSTGTVCLTALAAKQIVEGRFEGSGLLTPLAFDPEPFLAEMRELGLPMALEETAVEDAAGATDGF